MVRTKYVFFKSPQKERLLQLTVDFCTACYLSLRNITVISGLQGTPDDKKHQERDWHLGEASILLTFQHWEPLGRPLPVRSGSLQEKTLSSGHLLLLPLKGFLVSLI